MCNTCKKLDANELRTQARGRWLSIFQYVCPGMFDDAIAHLGSHVVCPFHGGENDFRFVKKGTKGRGNSDEDGVAMCTCGSFPDGFAVLMQATGMRFPDVLKQVNEYLNGTSAEPIKPRQIIVRPDTSAEDAAHDAELLAKVNSLWGSAKDMDLAVVPYYPERGISACTLADMRDTRYLPSLGYWLMVDKVLTKVGSFAAILVLMRGPNGDPVAVHRTWLSKDRTDKAPVLKAKKLSMTPGASGAAMRLYDAEGSEVLGLTEGIETGHAVRQLSAEGHWPELANHGTIPVWACYSANNIQTFIVPDVLLPTLKKIIVFADNDESGTGMRVALAFKDRMSLEHPQITVDIQMPPVAGMDWNDVLINK